MLKHLLFCADRHGLWAPYRRCNICATSCACFVGPRVANLSKSPLVQVIHGTATLGKPKVDSARDRMLDVNPHVKVETFHEQLTSENALRIVDGYDVVSRRGARIHTIATPLRDNSTSYRWRIDGEVNVTCASTETTSFRCFEPFYG